jgi:hypothetical protein
MVAAERTVVANAQSRLLEDLPAERRALVDEGNRQTEPARLRRSSEPGRAAADDQEVVRRRPCLNRI